MKALSSTVSMFSTTAVVLGRDGLVAAQSDPSPVEVKAVIAPDAADYKFGSSIAVSGSTLIVGSPEVEEGDRTGSARVFVRDDPSSNLEWAQQGPSLLVDDGYNRVYWDHRVALDGDTALVSARSYTDEGVEIARVFVFDRDAQGNWEQTDMLGFEGIYSYTLHMALDEDTAVVSWGTDINALGVVAVYTRSATGWSEQVLDRPEDYSDSFLSSDAFGSDVSISGGIVLVGDTSQSTITCLNVPVVDCNRTDYWKYEYEHVEFSKGKAHVFAKTVHDTWAYHRVLLPGDVSDGFGFGSTVAVDYDGTTYTAMVGHNTPYDNGNGNVHVFIGDYGGDWSSHQQLAPPEEHEEWDWDFGRSVFLKGNSVIIKSVDYDSAGYLYTRTNGVWSYQQTIKMLQNSHTHYTHNPGEGVTIGSDGAVYVGVQTWDQTRSDATGNVLVYDDFSELPLGPLEIDFWGHCPNCQDYNHTGFGYNIGYGREFTAALMKSDCETSLGDIITSTEFFEARIDLTHTELITMYYFDPVALKDDAQVFDEEESVMTVCSVVSLDGSDVESKQIVALELFDGDISFIGSWTNGNGITVNYKIGQDLDREAELLQKDCETPITDTNIEEENYSDGQYLNIRYDLDPSTIRQSEDIFDDETSTIEVCHVVRVNGTNSDDDEVEVRQIITIVLAEEGTFAGLFGDPHIRTFDELQFDCQAAGEFTTLTSLTDSTFKIQERFVAVESTEANTCAQASVSTGVAFADTGKPTIQLSTPGIGEASLNTVNGCPVDFFIDGDASTLSDDGDLSSFNVAVTLEDQNRIRIKHTDTLMTLDIILQESNSFGCHIMVQVALPGSFRSGETLLGLLGTPNGNRDDDWMAPDGTIIPPPTTDAERIFSTAFDYCRQNWCVRDSSASLFTYRSGESFEDFDKCDVEFSSEVEDAVSDPDSLEQTLVNECNGNLVCLVDGLCGDITDAVAALGNEQIVIETQEEVKASIFPREQVEVENVQDVSIQTQPSESPTLATSTLPSGSPTLATSTLPSGSLTLAPSTLFEGYFGNSGFELEFTTEYQIRITIKGTTCEDADDKSDFTDAEMSGLETALATGFCDTNNFPAGSCSIEIKTMECKDARRRSLKHVRGRKLDIEDNDLVINFVVAVEGQCVSRDCRNGNERMQAVGDAIESYAANELMGLLSALQAADSTLFASVAITDLEISYGDLLAPLLERLTVWYPMWGTEENTCSNDGKYELHMKTSGFVKSSLEECCNWYYSWAFNECLTLGGADSSGVASEEFYVHYASESCVQSCFEKDSTDTKNCGGIAPNHKSTYTTAEACCSEKLFWVDQASCVAASTKRDISDEDKGTKDWFVDWEKYKCVRDCVNGSDENCGGLAKHWEEKFRTASECCNTKLSWVERGKCTT